jgi:chloramphenicol O-acetyltransferase
MENWTRKGHYNHFKALDYPHFNICGNIDITQFHKFIKENEKAMKAETTKDCRQGCEKCGINM